MSKKLLLTCTLIVTTLFLSSCNHFNSHREKRAGKWIEKMDINKDGFVSRWEHKKYNNDKFNKIDTNKNGKICKRELADWIKTHKHKK